MMMVEHSFDRWQKDVFFLAAEEVQGSADIMESVYRAWDRNRRDGFHSYDSDELCRELQTVLGTTKWQLEEFERAIKLSHGSGSTEHTIARHRQFVIAIEDQISRIENALRDSFIEEGKQPLRWVQLDEEEREDLALFLSGTPVTSQDMKGSFVDLWLSKKDVGQQIQRKEDAKLGVDSHRESSGPGCIKGFKEIVTINNNAKYVVELEAKEVPKTQDEIHNYSREKLVSLDMDSWIIVIDDEDAAKKTMEERKEIRTHADNLCGLLRIIEPAAKLKWFRNSFRKEKDEEHLGLEQASSDLTSRGMTRFTKGINLLNERSRNCLSSCRKDSNVSRVRQLFGRVGGFKRHVQRSQYYMDFSRYLQVTLVLMLTIILTAPFLLYSN